MIFLILLGVGVLFWQKPDDKAQSEALLQFLADDLLVRADPYSAIADSQKQAQLRAQVERILPGMDDRFGSEPALLMSLHHAVARAFSLWGDYQQAVTHALRSKQIAEQLSLTPEVIALEASLCRLWRLSGEFKAAEQACDIAVNYAIGANAPGLLAVRVERATLLYEVQKFRAATDELLLVMVSAGPATDLHIIADAQGLLARSLHKLMRFNDADAAFKALLESRQQLDQNQHPLMARAYADYGDFLVQVGRYKQASTLLARAKALFNETLGPGHMESVGSAFSQAVLYNESQQWHHAIETLEPVLTVYRNSLGPDHALTLHAVNEMALAQAGASDGQSARQFLSQAKAISKQRTDKNPALLAHAHLRWAQTLFLLKDYEGAELELGTARHLINEAYPRYHPLHASALCLAAHLSLQQDDRLGARMMTNYCAEQVGALKLPASSPLHRQLVSLNRSLVNS